MYFCGVKSLLLFAVAVHFRGCNAALGKDPFVCTKQTDSTICVPKARRYDMLDFGYENYFHGWADVQGQGAAGDYCRIVGIRPNIFLACALAGTHGQSEYNYKSIVGFDIGYQNTWYMKDEDGDGRDDYCRCVGNEPSLKIVCTKAGERGFYGSAEQGGNTSTFIITDSTQCDKQKVRPEFGRPTIHL